MRRLRELTIGRRLLLALYVLAVVTLGFAHKPISFSKVSGPTATDLVSFAMPDGSLPEICWTGGAGTPGKPHHVGASCEACLLTAAPGLPVASADVGKPLFSSVCRLGPVSEAVPIDRRLATAAQPRAPPRSLAV
jgi:hypothetical protein